MPRTEVRAFKDKGRVPIFEWFADLQREPKLYAKCLSRIKRLAECGNELRRPEIDYLYDGIYELRIKYNHVNYRILYFFCGKDIVCVSHGLTKEDKVPDSEILTAIAALKLVKQTQKSTQLNGMCRMARTRNLADYIKAQMAADPALATAIEEEAINAHIAQQVYDLRIAAKLTQKELAERIGTQQSVISRIEDADYEGHSLALLKKIADALGKRLSIEFSDLEPTKADEKPVSASEEFEIRLNQLEAGKPLYLLSLIGGYASS
jgi:transcriptional regulator with XRE-family HTH domain/phage-related protein